MCPLMFGEGHTAQHLPLIWKSLNAQGWLEVTEKKKKKGEERSIVGRAVLPQVGRAGICVFPQDTMQMRQPGSQALDILKGSGLRRIYAWISPKANSLCYTAGPSFGYLVTDRRLLLFKKVFKALARSSRNGGTERSMKRARKIDIWNISQLGKGRTCWPIRKEAGKGWCVLAEYGSAKSCVFFPFLPSALQTLGRTWNWGNRQEGYGLDMILPFLDQSRCFNTESEPFIYLLFICFY